MKSMKHERPEVGSIIEASIDNQSPDIYEVVGYFDKTRSVFLYEAPFTPIVREWDDVEWEGVDDTLQEMIKDVNDWDEQGLCTLEEYLVKQGWRKDDD